MKCMIININNKHDLLYSLGLQWYNIILFYYDIILYIVFLSSIYYTKMKNLLKIGALSLALLSAIFMLNTNAAENGDLTLEITGNTWYCDLGKSADLGDYTFNYNAFTASGDFNAVSGNVNTWYCNDLGGSTPWRVELSSTAVANITTNNPTHTIANTSVFIKANAWTKTAGVCTVNSGSSLGVRQALNSPVVLFGKTSAIGEVCNIQTTGVQLQVDLAASQALGQYSGTLTIDLIDFLP